MNLKIEKILTPYNFTDRNDVSRIRFIVIHYFGALGTAKAVARYFASAYRGASAHYSTDEGDTAYQLVEDGDISWHCGTSGTYFHPECRNSNSIGIEVRPFKMDTSSKSSSDRDWFFTEKIISNLSELTVYLMDKYKVPPENVLRHYDVTHKWCPRPFMGDDINAYFGVSGNAKWAEFKAGLIKKEKEEPEVTLDEFKKLYKEMISEQKGDRPSNWAKESCDKAKAAGVFAGDGKGNYNWQDPVTREAVAALLDRTGLL